MRAISSGREHHLPVLVGRVGGLVQQQFGRGPAELVAGWRTEVSGTAAAAANSMSS